METFLEEDLTMEQIITTRRENCEDIKDFTPANDTGEVYCPREFDGWSCVNWTSAGQVAHFPCPYFILGFDPKRFGQRTCLMDGSWFRHPDSNKTWSNYTTCVDLEDLELRKQVNLIYKTGYSISLAALIISLFIFFYFKPNAESSDLGLTPSAQSERFVDHGHGMSAHLTDVRSSCVRNRLSNLLGIGTQVGMVKQLLNGSLSCTRIQIHKNLFLSLTINNCLWLIWYEAVVDNLPVLMTNGLGCQALHLLVQYFLVATYLWMFCEGLYLHTLLVVTFLTESRVMPLLYFIGWGVPAILVLIYAAMRSSLREEKLHCWIHESLYSWTLSGPVCISMLANLVFLINIVRLLLTKLHTGQPVSPKASFQDPQSSVRLRRRNTVMSQTGVMSGRTRKAVRATFILIPLLGLQYILMPFRPQQGAAWEPAYQIISAVVTSYQGLCVASLFCFFNGEVLAAIKKKWHQCHLNKQKPWPYSCSGITTLSFSRASFVQEMADSRQHRHANSNVFDSSVAVNNVQL